MKHYVLGFIFNRTQDKVLLVRKEKPSWQAGNWNGIGGKVEEKDLNPLEAMQRECMEKVNYEYDWEHCVTFVCPGGTVFVYKAISDYKTLIAGKCNIIFGQIEDEKLQVWRVDSLPDNMMNNLNWLIPVCLSTLQFPFIVHDMALGVKAVEKNTKTKCRLCKGTGKPCNGCGEYHPDISMCPPHEVRMKWAKNICPDCGCEEGDKNESI